MTTYADEEHITRVAAAAETFVGWHDAWSRASTLHLPRVAAYYRDQLQQALGALTEAITDGLCVVCAYPTVVDGFCGSCRETAGRVDLDDPATVERVRARVIDELRRAQAGDGS